MYEPINYMLLQSRPRQEQEPAKHKPTLADLCDRFEQTVFVYWLLGICTQGVVLWLLANIAKAI